MSFMSFYNLFQYFKSSNRWFLAIYCIRIHKRPKLNQNKFVTVNRSTKTDYFKFKFALKTQTKRMKFLRTNVCVCDSKWPLCMCTLNNNEFVINFMLFTRMNFYFMRFLVFLYWNFLRICAVDMYGDHGGDAYVMLLTK